MQRVAKQTRKVNRWNAYLHSQVEVFNEGLDPTQPRPRLHEISQGIRERWDAMTEEERIAATEDAVVELEDLRESRQAAKRESRISTTRDIRVTLDTIEAELQDLCTRTGAEILLVSVRSDVENFSTKPRVFTSSPRVGDFFQLSNNRTINDFAVKLQAYCVADIQAPIVSPALNVQQQVLEMKRKVKELINERLQECAHPARMPRINYVDFETCITERHGIVCENWPLPNFCAPGSINNLSELEVLYRAWSTGVTTFRKLSPEEWKQLKDVRTQKRLEAAILQTSIARANAAQSSPVTATPPEVEPHTPPTITSSASTDESSLASETSQSSCHTSSEFGSPKGPTSSITTSPMPDSASPTSAVHDSLSFTPVNDAQERSPVLADHTTSVDTSAFATAAEIPVPSSSTSPLPSEPSQDGYVLFPAEATSNFVFTTGKRLPPSSFSVLAPISLVQKNPRKRRADAGVKRGPNKRTIGKLSKSAETESSSPADEARDTTSPTQHEVLDASMEMGGEN